MSSRSPGVKFRPAMIFSCGRRVKAVGSTPRIVMFAPLLTSPLRTSSAITMSSAEASGLPSAPARIPGCCSMRSVESRSRAELSSASEPPRRMTTTSCRPVDLSVLSKPAAMASSAVNTATTPASPMTMTSDGAQRSGMLRMLRPVIANACLITNRSPESVPGERVYDLQAPRPQRRQEPHGEAHQRDRQHPEQPHRAVELEQELSAGRLLHHRAGERGEHHAHQAPGEHQGERLGEDEAEHAAVGEAERLQHRE